MNFFGIGLPEMAVIAAVGLLVFGPKRLPELGRTLGRTLKGFQSASREFEQEFRQAIDTETVTARPNSPTMAQTAEPIVSEAPVSEAASLQAASPEAAVAQPTSEPGGRPVELPVMPELETISGSVPASERPASELPAPELPASEQQVSESGSADLPPQSLPISPS